MTASARQPFRWPVRVYYEDTDAAGIVYYANYLKYLERARTEWLAAMGFGLAELEMQHAAVFVVHRVEIDYRRPARLGDALTVTVAPVDVGRSRLVVVQNVQQDARGEGLVLTTARVTLAFVARNTWRPTRVPASLLSCMESRA
ncbi:MAG: tol-pal system-associated acyl-CoA thioesterase [Casimicrobiaceae bacterium]